MVVEAAAARVIRLGSISPAHGGVLGLEAKPCGSLGNGFW
jgi:hypothetical protein